MGKRVPAALLGAKWILQKRRSTLAAQPRQIHHKTAALAQFAARLDAAAKGAAEAGGDRESHGPVTRGGRDRRAQQLEGPSDGSTLANGRIPSAALDR